MPSTPIHPGEHLAEELSALGLSAAALARHLKVPTNWITQSARTLIWHECTVLDESADPLRSEVRRA
jgi:plasmid maintenance system antidote protein VapI